MKLGNVTVITPAYNHANYITQSVESVLAQTTPDWELIIINDGSSDQTREVVAPFVRPPQIRYFEQTNQGQAAARNFGVGEASGDYLLFLDDDDVLESDALAWMVPYLAANLSVVAVVGGVQYIDGSGNMIGLPQGFDRELQFLDLFSGNAFASPGQALIRKSAFLEVGMIDPTLKGVDDYDLMFRLTKLGVVKCFSRVTLSYRWHGGNASANKSRMYDPVCKVQERYLSHVPSGERGKAASIAANYLYNYAGSAVLRDALLAPGRSIANRLSDLKKLWKQFGGCLFLDVRLMVSVLKSFQDICREFLRSLRT